MAGNGRVLTSQYSFEQTIHVIRLKWWLQVAHLVSYAAERPNVRLKIVWLVFPHLRARVVRGARLRVQQALLGHLTHIQVAQLGCGVLIQEYVGTLHVAMEDVQLMKALETSDHLDHSLPNVLLLVVLLIVLILADSLENITIICKLHHNA